MNLCELLGPCDYKLSPSEDAEIPTEELFSSHRSVHMRLASLRLTGRKVKTTIEDINSSVPQSFITGYCKWAKDNDKHVSCASASDLGTFL